MEERRKARRCAAALFIRFHDEDAPDINYGSFTQDVSVDGVRLLSPYRLKTDTTLKMRIDVPENPDLTVAEGSVRWVGKSPVTDENGDPTRMGEVGDLWVRGLSMASGYWEQAELSATRFVDGWFHTGDKFRCDESGNYWYAGRSDDMFRVSGQWVSPIEVENALLQHPEVRDAAVVAFEDDNGLLKPRAFVILVSGADPGSELAEVLKAHVKRLITPYKYPRRIVFVDDFPRSPTGKVLRHVLRRTLA